MLYGTKCWSAKKQHINEMRNEGKSCKRWFGHVWKRATYESVKKEKEKEKRKKEGELIQIEIREW